MPYYNFKNNETGEEFEEFFTISGKEEFLKENPHIIQTPSMFGILVVQVIESRTMMVGKKTYHGLQKHIHVQTFMTDMVRNTKQVKTEQVLKKHKVI